MKPRRYNDILSHAERQPTWHSNIGVALLMRRLAAKEDQRERKRNRDPAPSGRRNTT